MALFGIGKKKKDSGAVSVAGKPTGSLKTLEKPVISGSGEQLSAFPLAIIRSRVTEKATDLQAERVYCFDVLPSAGKREIAFAVGALYNVSPVKVRVVKVPGKRLFARGKVGFKSGGKKAYVYLKEGDKIEVV